MSLPIGIFGFSERPGGLEQFCLGLFSKDKKSEKEFHGFYKRVNYCIRRECEEGFSISSDENIPELIKLIAESVGDKPCIRYKEGGKVVVEWDKHPGARYKALDRKRRNEEIEGLSKLYEF